MTANSFAVPPQIEADLVRIREYWRGLIRGNADMAYWDDVKPHDLHDLQRQLMLIDVFEDPQRFRFRLVGEQVGKASGQDLANRFADDVRLTGPLDALDRQCSATVASRAPTYHHQEQGDAWSRLILPMWGNGRIEMLLGAAVRSTERDGEFRS